MKRQFLVASIQSNFFRMGTKPTGARIAGSGASAFGDEPVDCRVSTRRLRRQPVASRTGPRRHGLRLLPQIPPESAQAARPRRLRRRPSVSPPPSILPLPSPLNLLFEKKKKKNLPSCSKDF